MRFEQQSILAIRRSKQHRRQRSLDQGMGSHHKQMDTRKEEALHFRPLPK